MSTEISPEAKYKLIKEIAEKRNINVMIETGTLGGDALYILMNTFLKIYSIEIDIELYKNAIEKFKHCQNIEILYGDSALILPTILEEKINERCLFWLDAHTVDSSPILHELNAIKNHWIKNHIILIDDYSYFYGTIKNVRYEDISKCLKEMQYNNFRIENDILIVGDNTI